MFLFILSFFSFVLVSNPFPLKPLPRFMNEFRLLFLFLQELVHHPIEWLKQSSILLSIFFMNFSPPSTHMKRSEKREASEGPPKMAILDLPELALDCIMEKLSPIELRSMAGVCSSLKVRCESNFLWERHVREKWGRVLGEASLLELQKFLDSEKGNSSLHEGIEVSRHWILKALSSAWPFSWARSSRLGNREETCVSLPTDSIMSQYLALESGRFWFSAQVYNREGGHVGFLLSCYDAEISYDNHTDTFCVRYLPHGKRPSIIEQGVKWSRIRAPPVDTLPHELHPTCSLNDLRPGDHVEIQWRKNKEFPYGWWYGVVGHLESCDGNERYCRCYETDTLVLDFNQFSSGSRWRRKTIDRKDHREEGNEVEGFYGSIRKLHEEEISVWKQFWPTATL